MIFSFKMKQIHDSHDIDLSLLFKSEMKLFRSFKDSSATTTERYKKRQMNGGMDVFYVQIKMAFAIK